jgi:hypothetical protein
MQETLIKYCKLLQDNESERLKAKQSYQNETKIVQLKDNELKDVERDLQQEKLNKESIGKKLEYLKQYDDFLTRVISDHKDTYANKNELIQRHQTLKAANDSLEAQREEGERELAELKKKFNMAEKEKTDTLLKLNNEVAALQKRLEVKAANFGKEKRSAPDSKHS